MAYDGPAIDLSDRIDDRAETDHEFRLHRSIFEDADIFDAEILLRKPVELPVP
jgi:hypothetical protein